MNAIATDPLLRSPRSVDPGATAPRAMLALARFEAIRVLRHPVSIAAILLFLGPWFYLWARDGASQFPVMANETFGVQLITSLLFGGATMVVANLAVLRGRRHRTEAADATLVLPAWWRAGGLLLALLPYAAVVTAIVAIRLVITAAAPDVAGQLDLAELATLPLLVVLPGAVGVLLGQFIRSVVVVPIALVLFTVYTFVIGPGTAPGGSVWRFLQPVISPDVLISLPTELLDRPAGRHLSYLAGLTAMCALATLMRAGARGRAPLIAVITAGIVTVACAASQYAGADRVQNARAMAVTNPARQQTCRPIGAVTYCAFADFGSWIPSWDQVVRGVQRRVPPSALTGPALAVRQRISVDGLSPNNSSVTRDEMRQREDDWRRANATTPDAVAVGTAWGENRDAATLAGAVAYRLITGRPAGDDVVCGARGAVLIWLAGQAAPGTRDGVHELDDASSGALMFWGSSLPGIFVPDREAAAGLALLDRPVEQVAAVVSQHWAELTAADTGAERLSELFDIPLGPPVPAMEQAVCSA